MNADEGPGGQGSGASGRRFQPRRIDWWSCATQFVGTLLFNMSTFNAMQAGLDTTSTTPSSGGPTPSARSVPHLRLSRVRRGGRPFAAGGGRLLRIAAVNLLGCIAFGISAIAAYMVPSTGSVVDLAAANFFTAFGGLCFLVGAMLLLPEAAGPSDASPS